MHLSSCEVLADRRRRHGPLVSLDVVNTRRVLPVLSDCMRGSGDGVTSAEIRLRVESARAIQQRRGFYNAHISHRLLPKLCSLDDAGERTLETAVRRMGLSARTHDRILKVASSWIN